VKTLTQAEIDAIRDSRYRLTARQVYIKETCGELSQESFTELMDAIYKSGASCDVAYISYENAYYHGVITLTEYRWLKFKSSLGSLKRSVISGVRSVLRTLGSRLTTRK
jgi:hypothetical protein